jgi:hypothetical protein
VVWQHQQAQWQVREQKKIMVWQHQQGQRQVRGNNYYGLATPASSVAGQKIKKDTQVGNNMGKRNPDRPNNLPFAE